MEVFRKRALAGGVAPGPAKGWALKAILESASRSQGHTSAQCLG